MDISISSRHYHVTPRLEEVIHDKIGHLDRFFDGPVKTEIHLEGARNQRIPDKNTCEVTLESRGHHVRCKVQAPDPYTAVDLATAKLERQIRKLRTRLDKRNHGRGASIRDAGELAALGAVMTVDSPVEDEDLGGEDHTELRIVKTKRFHLGPLSPEDAALKMDLLGHGFFFFINSDTGRSAVVYRRDDGDVGLIDEAG